MAKKTNQAVDCRDCKYQGEHGDHMVFCKILKIFRSYGKRICDLFKKR